MHYSINTSFKPNHAIMWIKLDKYSLSLDHDVYLGAVYLWPEGSHIYDINDVDLFNILQDDIVYFEQRGVVLTCGDFNARVNTEDYVTLDYVNTDRGEQLSDCDQPLSRVSRDSGVNNH